MKTTFSKQEIAALERDALRYVIPHFAHNPIKPKIFVRGEGCYLWDIHGKRYMDTFASLLTTICGHNRPEVAKAINEQAQLLEFFPNYVDTYTVPLVKLARKLAEIMPGDLEVTFFVNSGSEANETAIKMARQYHLERGEPRRFKIIGRKYSYSGTTLGGTSATGLAWFREYFEPLMPGFIIGPSAHATARELGVKDPDGLCGLRAMERLIEWEGPDTIAAIIMDPIPGSNVGYPLPPKGYLPGLRKICDKYGILLIFDEVQTGFGKTGKWFACEHWNVVPDIMTIGKGFTGGYIPLAAAVARRPIAEVFMKKPGSELRSGSTYGGHTIACAATLANIEVIEKNRLVERAAENGKFIEKRLKAMMNRYPIIGDVRGIGMLWAVELMADRKSQKPFDPKLGIGSWIREWCWDHGMILRNNGDILVYAPALIMTREEIEEMLSKTEQAIAAAMKHFGLGKATRARR